MKKIIALSLVSALSTLLLVGCSANSVSPSSGDAKNINRTHVGKKLTQQRVHKLIIEACEKNGWRTTEFKINSLIAEKTDGDNTTAVTIEFDDSFFEIFPHNDELQDIIEDALN